jgi:hypothetical protein
LFRARGAPEKMAQGYKAYYDEVIAKGLANMTGPGSAPPAAV